MVLLYQVLKEHYKDGKNISRSCSKTIDKNYEDMDNDSVPDIMKEVMHAIGLARTTRLPDLIPYLQEF